MKAAEVRKHFQMLRLEGRINEDLLDNIEACYDSASNGHYLLDNLKMDLTVSRYDTALEIFLDLIYKDNKKI